MCVNSIDFSTLDLMHYSYDDDDKVFYLKNKNISTYYISQEQIKIYDYLNNYNIALNIDSTNNIKLVCNN